MKKIGYYIEIIKKNLGEFHPKYNDFILEIAEEPLDNKRGTRHSLWFYIPTLYQKLTKQRATIITEAMGCKDVLLLDDDTGVYAVRKIAIGFWDKEHKSNA